MAASNVILGQLLLLEMCLNGNWAPPALPLRLQVCCLLLTAGARPEAATSERETALAMAARGDHCSIVRLLLSQPRVNPDHADCDLNTPAHHVAYKGCLMCTVALLRYGASADTPNTLMVGEGLVDWPMCVVQQASQAPL